MKKWIITTADGWEPVKCIKRGVLSLHGPKMKKCLLSELEPIMALEEYQKANTKRPTSEVLEIYIVEGKWFSIVAKKDNK